MYVHTHMISFTYFFPLLSPFYLPAERNQLPSTHTHTRTQLITQLTKQIHHELPIRMWDFLLTVSWGPVSSFESGTGWFWWSVVCICVEWIEASRSNSHQSVPELSHNFYSVSPARAQKHLLAHPCTCFLTCTSTNQNSPDLLPKPGRECCSLNHLHVEETLTCKNKSVITQLRLVEASCCVPYLSPPWW